MSKDWAGSHLPNPLEQTQSKDWLSNSLNKTLGLNADFPLVSFLSYAISAR